MFDPGSSDRAQINGVRSRVRNSETGKTTGAVHFTNGPTSHILRNRHYIGEVNHKGKSWPGELVRIIDVKLLDAVQEKLASQRQRHSEHVLSSTARLMGSIYNDAGERMLPNYVVKKGVRYRYYLAASLVQGRKDSQSSILRVPAEHVEAAVAAAIQNALIDNELSASIAKSTQAQLVKRYLDRVTLRPKAIDLILRDQQNPDAPAKHLTAPWTKPAANIRREILQPEAPIKNLRHIRADEQARLLRAIARARRWVDELINGAISDAAAIATREDKSERSVRMSLSLAFLDPAIIEAACQGKLPRGYGVSRLVDLPPVFEDQWRALGLVRPV